MEALSKTNIPGALSAIIIAKDEEEDIPGALKSLEGLADEIIVLVAEDSSDKTAQIAREAGAKVFTRKFDGYAGQKQAALDSSTGRWVLSLDADERVSDELRKTIISTLAQSPAEAGFEISFEVNFLGRHLKFGGLGSERHIRLFERNQGKFVGGSLHEGVALLKPPSFLRPGAIIHEPYKNISEYLLKLDRYTTLAAHKLESQGKRFHAWHHLLLPWEFFSRAFLRLGFLDGTPGLVWAGLSAFYSWLKYVKLKELGHD